MSAYFGLMDGPHSQICGTCAQTGKILTKEQKQKISDTLTGIMRSDEFKDKLSRYMKENKEGIERGRANLVPGAGGGWNTGMTTPDEVRAKQSASNMGVKKTDEHRSNISSGRKKMLAEQGGLLPETKAKISKATIKQYQNGFEPKLFHRRGTHVTPDGRKVTYRSSYEKRAFMILDNDPTVETYEYEPFPIVYRKPDSNYDSNYLIDLMVTYKSGVRKLIEIKPAKRTIEPIVIAKIEAAHKMAQKLGYLFEVWTENTLFSGCEKTLRVFVDTLDKI